MLYLVLKLSYLSPKNSPESSLEVVRSKVWLVLKMYFFEKFSTPSISCDK